MVGHIKNGQMGTPRRQLPCRGSGRGAAAAPAGPPLLVTLALTRTYKSGCPSGALTGDVGADSDRDLQGGLGRPARPRREHLLSGELARTLSVWWAAIR